MMHRNAIILTALVLLNMAFTKGAIAQTTRSHSIRLTLNLVSLLDVEPTGTAISLAMGQPTDAGLPVQTATNNTKWVNYTSCMGTATTSRTVSAKLTGTLPSGVGLQLQAGSCSGSGSGVFGTSDGTVTLMPGVSTQIISGIRGAYTGNGTNNGHQLTYTLLISNYANLVAGSYGPLVVTYTISN